MIGLGAQMVTVVRQTISATGDRVETGRDVVACCSVQPLSPAELVDSGERVVARWRLLAPSTLVAGPVDRLIVDDLSYELDGVVQVWRGLDGRPHHVEAVLRRVTG